APAAGLRWAPMRALPVLPALLLLFAPLLARAQADAPAPEAHPGIEACVAIEIDATRLACYDEAMRRELPAPQEADAMAEGAPAGRRARARGPSGDRGLRGDGGRRHPPGRLRRSDAARTADAAGSRRDGRGRARAARRAEPVPPRCAAHPRPGGDRRDRQRR